MEAISQHVLPAVAVMPVVVIVQVIHHVTVIHSSSILCVQIVVVSVSMIVSCAIWMWGMCHLHRTRPSASIHSPYFLLHKRQVVPRVAISVLVVVHSAVVVQPVSLVL